jgi:hypothetical protein
VENGASHPYPVPRLQLSAVGYRSTVPAPLVWNTPALGVSSHAQIISVKRDDGGQGLPSDPVGQRFVEHMSPPSPSTSPQQNKISVALEPSFLITWSHIN